LLVEHEAFRDAILGRANDIVTLRDGLDTLRVAEAVVEASRTSTAITI
jgi:UDP-N-acetylglucosamine 3-dehydrogenase